jgi:hypothetical protein
VAQAGGSRAHVGGSRAQAVSFGIKVACGCSNKNVVLCYRAHDYRLFTSEKISLIKGEGYKISQLFQKSYIFFPISLLKLVCLGKQFNLIFDSFFAINFYPHNVS